MSFLHRFSIFQRLLALGGLALAGLLGVSAIGVLAQESIFQSSRQVINVHKRIEFLGEKSLTALLNVRRYEKDLLLNMGDPQKQEEYRKKWLGALAESHQLYAAMAATSPEYAEFQGRLDLSLKEYESAASKVLDRAIQGGYLNPGEANDSITVVAKVVIHRMETDIKAAASKAELGATAAWTEAESQARTARLAMITLSLLAGGITLAGVTVLAIGTARSLKQGVAVASAIAEGRLDNEIVAVGSDETATLLRALGSMQEHLHDRNARDHEAASEMTRIKIALDSVSIPVRIADPAGRVIYANLAMLQTLHRLEPALRAQNPAFRSEGFVGSSIGAMYADPDAGLRRLAALTKTVDIIMDIGGRTYRVVTSPVFDAQGARLGSVGEWQDRTDQLLVENEISAIVGNASAGHLDRRIDPAGKDGFFLTLAQGINGLLDATQQALVATSEVLSRVAQGDLTQTIDANYTGIFGQLKDDTNATITRLREVVSRIQDTADAINTGSKEIAAGNQNLSGRTEEQASSLEETASSMEELTAMVKQNAENARTANELARQSNEIANRGGALVKGVVATMGEIQDSSRKIEDIIGVVDSIAFQTNILALNAAVEAARAGEQGRGFAVVASEVRSLAQRSATAAREIKALIAESVGKVEGGARLVEQAGSTIDEVVVSFQRVAGLVTDISAASREQSSGIEQVTRAVSQMDEITQQNAALVEQAAAAAEGLQEQAQGLVRAVGRFKLACGDIPLNAPPAHSRSPRTALPAAKKLPTPRQASKESAWEEF